MKKTIDCMAIDLGASGGKVFLGSFDGNKITLKDLYRFPKSIIGKMHTSAF